MRSVFRAAVAAFLGCGVFLLTGISPIAAHEHRHVGIYELVAGWTSEPAIEGQKNGIEFRVAEEEAQTPITGLEASVQVEVTHLATSTRKTFPLKTVFNAPGRYTVDMLVTAPGDYVFRFFGTIGQMALNETFNSAEGKFSNVGTAQTIQFPITLPSGREMESAVRGAAGVAGEAQVAAAAAKEKAESAGSMSRMALAAGLLGSVLGAGSLVLSLRKR